MLFSQLLALLEVGHDVDTAVKARRFVNKSANEYVRLNYNLRGGGFLVDFKKCLD